MPDSPFKFLSSYEKEDIDFYFGREEEIEALYEMTYDTRLILLYGASGSGKTSLVQCGLANKFRETRWKDIFIRRETDLNQALNLLLDKELEKTGGLSLGIPENAAEKIEYIYRAIFKPIYLIFDQFEELFLVNPNPTEQATFFSFLKTLLQSKIACKVILVMREEFIAHLWNFEEELPNLFDHRYRIEPMRFSKAKTVIENTLNKLANDQSIQLEQSKIISEKILKKLTKEKRTLELTYLQVYLDKLYQEAIENNEQTLPVFSPQLVEKVGNFEDIIGAFLSDQIEALELELGPEQRGIPIKILGSMITDEKTKKVLNAEALDAIRQKFNLSKPAFFQCLQAFENMRILKRLD